MKKTKIIAIVLATVVICGAFLVACDNTQYSEYTITLNASKDFKLTVGDEVDFTQYFIVKNRDGMQITVT